MADAPQRTNKFRIQRSLTLFNTHKRRDRHMKALPANAKGFTLVELLVAMAVGLVVMIAIYAAYINHSRSHVTQQLVVNMQQNARAAMSLMKREIRMAGYDPVATDGVDNDGDSFADNGETSTAKMINAEEDTISFSADITYNGSIDNEKNEEITYWLDGTTLMRQDKGGDPQIIAYDIEAVAFAYAVDNEPVADPDGIIDTTANGHIRWFFDTNNGDDDLDQTVEDEVALDDGVIDINDPEGGANWPGAQVHADKVRAVRIWLLARTRQPIKGHTDNRTYVVGPLRRGPADGDWDPRRKRVLLTATVYCRNLR
jgi:type IV pilus assembly protein PilW